jgi:tetratricopeptide (TPR) repeat protein
MNPMDEAPVSSRLFVTRKLPWILAGVAFAAFLITRNAWIGPNSLRAVFEAAGWGFENDFAQPLHQIFGMALSSLTGPKFPGQANLLTAAMAAVVVYLLARCVALLPHDRRHEERIREFSDIALLTIPLAWVPPVLAVGLLAFQSTFWQHATAFTGEMIDLLIFAIAVRNLLEYRLDRRESRLWMVSCLLGMGMANSYAFLGFLPMFLTAIVWIRGWSFFNLAFLARMFLAGLVGLSLLLWIPLSAKMSGRLDEGFWSLLRSGLELKAGQLLMYPRGRFLFLALMMIAPLVGAGIRWPSRMGAGLDTLAANVAWQVLALAWFGLCIAVAFDVKFSPRQLGYGVPLLTFSFCASLAVGYFAGYYLLVWTGRPDSRHAYGIRSGTVALSRLAGLSVLALTLLVPVGLVARNWRVVVADNGPALREYVLTMLAPLHRAPGLVFAEDPMLAMALTAGNEALGAKAGHLVVNTRLAPMRAYRQFMARRHGERWPALKTIAEANENIAGLWLTLATQAAGSNQTFFASSVFSFFAEPFDFRPVGSLHGAIPRRGLLPSVPSEGEFEQVRRFWREVQPSLDAVARDAALGSANAVQVGALWSRSANASGVFLQEWGRLKEAGDLFREALRLNTNNVSARVNQQVNQALAAAGPIPADLVKVWDGKAGLLDLHGPVDEPEFLRVFGNALLAQKDDMVRRAAVSFARASRLSPTNQFNRFGFIAAALAIGDLASATNALNELRGDPGRARWNPLEKAGLAEAEGRVLIAMNQWAAAEAPLVEARRLNPGNPELCDYLSYLYLLLGKTDQSLAMTEAWEKVAKSDPAPMSRRALILMQLGRHGPAVEALTQVLDRDSSNPVARVNRAIARLMLKQFAESRSDYERLIKDGRETFQVQFGLAEIARQEKRPAEELKHLERYLELAPKNTSEHTNVVTRVAALRQTR